MTIDTKEIRDAWGTDGTHAHRDEVFALCDEVDRLNAKVVTTIQDGVTAINEMRAECDQLRAEMAEARKTVAALLAEKGRSYVPQDIALECVAFLECAGFGKPGTPNTLWAMTREACKTVDALTKVAAVMRSFEAGGVPFDWPGVSDGAALMSVDRWVKERAHKALVDAGLIDCAECAVKAAVK